jgi:hypothetical protein
MELRLDVESEDPDDLSDLRGWLEAEPGLRGLVDEVVGAPVPGNMGALAEMLTVIAGSGGALTVLASSLRVWFAQPRRADVKVTITTPEGRRISVDARRAADPNEIVQTVLAAGNTG